MKCSVAARLDVCEVATQGGMLFAAETKEAVNLQQTHYYNAIGRENQG